MTYIEQLSQIENMNSSYLKFLLRIILIFYKISYPISIKKIEPLTVENIIEQLEIAKNMRHQSKLDLLKHYLLNFILI